MRIVENCAGEGRFFEEKPLNDDFYTSRESNHFYSAKRSWVCELIGTDNDGKLRGDYLRLIMEFCPCYLGETRGFAIIVG